MACSPCVDVVLVPFIEQNFHYTAEVKETTIQTMYERVLCQISSEGYISTINVELWPGLMPSLGPIVRQHLNGPNTKAETA
jgi:hypothetical protein